MLNKLVWLFFLCVAINSGGVYSAQVFSVKNGDSISVRISSSEMTRIMSNVKLTAIWGVEGTMEVQSDEANGEGYILPSRSSSPSFSFFVKDEYENTYTIVATKSSVPSQTINLIVPLKKTAGSVSREYKSSSYKKKIRTLMKAMITNDEINGYSYHRVDKNISLWKGTGVSLAAQYVGVDFIGEVYSLNNKSGEEMVLAESEFNNFGRGVRAISIMKTIVEPEGFTFVYLVRNADQEDIH